MSQQTTQHRYKSLYFSEIYFCNSPIARLRGVFFRKKFTQKHAVLLKNCSSVHGIGMFKALDVVFLDENNCVLAITTLNPFGMCIHRGASSVLELCVGKAKDCGVEVGDCLNLYCLSKLSRSSLA